MLRGNVQFGIYSGWTVKPEEEEPDSTGEVFPCRHSTQAGHLQPGPQGVALVVFCAQLVTVPLDGVQNAFKTGTIPNSGQFAA